MNMVTTEFNQTVPVEEKPTTTQRIPKTLR